MMPAAVKSLIERLKIAWHERAIALKALSFAMVGVLNSAVDFAVFSFAYYFLVLPIVAANTLAWIIAVSGSYVLNSMITFAHESGRRLTPKGYFGFALSQVGGFLANTITVWCLVELLNVPAWAAKIAAIAASFAVNFSLSHFVVFSPRGDAR